MYNTIEKWQFPIVGFNADYAIAYKNKFQCDISWTTGDIPESDGITFSGGHHISIIGNTVTDGLFGIFTGGTQGTDWGNNTSNCLWGQILCKATGYNIGGTAVTTDIATTKWLVMFNDSHDNFESGYLVIDGANDNLLKNNKASNNPKYDIELTGDTYRFGFFTPKSFENKVHAYLSLKVKDCGDNNKVSGGTIVDNTTDPCF